MKKFKTPIFASLFILGSLFITLTGPTATAVTDNGTGIFWLYSGSNGTGSWRDFNMGPSRLYDLTTMTYVQGGSMNNSVSSAVFSCGSVGTAIDPGDNISFYDANNGTTQIAVFAPNYPGSCSNGVIKMNLQPSADNRASSIHTNDH